MIQSQDEFDWLGEVKPIGQQLQQKKTIKPDEFDWLNDIKPLSQRPKPEPKLSLLDQIKAFASKYLPAIQKAAPDIIPAVPGLKEPYVLSQAAAGKKEVPEEPKTPQLRAMTPNEEVISHNILSTVKPKEEYPESRNLEYGFLEKILDIPGQFLTNYVKSFAWGLPELIPGEEPKPKSEVGSMAGGVGSLLGLMGAGAGDIAKLAPFKVTGKVANRVWKKPAKTIAGKVIQNVLKTANTLGLALGATEWQGRDAKEILRNKKDAFLSGEATGAFFGTMQFVNLSNAYPMLSKIFRVGLGTGLLDIAEKKSPLDDRSLFKKAYDYGLNYYFLKEGVSPKEYQRAFEGISREAKRFNREAAKDGMKVHLEEDPQKIKALLAQKSEVPEPTFIATEKTVMPANTPERDIILQKIKESEPAPILEQKPRTKAETTVNIKPQPDGSIDVKIKKPESEYWNAPKPGESALSNIPTAGELWADQIWNSLGKPKAISYADIANNSSVQKGYVEIQDVLDALKKKGIKVYEPGEKPAKKGKKPITFKDPLYQAISKIGKIKPNEAFPRSELINVLPPQLIASAKGKEGVPMDLMAQALSEWYPKIESDNDLYTELENRKIRARNAPKKSEVAKAEQQAIEDEYLQFQQKEKEKEADLVAKAAEIKERFDAGEDPIALAKEAHNQGVPINMLPDELNAIVEKEKSAEAYRANIKRISKEKPAPPPEQPPWPKPKEQFELKETAPLAEKAEKGEAKVKETGPLFEQLKTPEIRQIVEKLEKGTGKELTAKEKQVLKDADLYEGPKEENVSYPKPYPETTPEKAPKKLKLVSVSIKTPTGKMESIGEVPVEKLENIKKYARSMGIEDKLQVGKQYLGKWHDYLPPSEVEQYAKDLIKDVKEQPESVWKEWQKEDNSAEQSVKNLYAGMSPPDFVYNYAKRALNALQIEPQFKGIGAPDTGLAIKRFHSIRNMIGGKALREIGRMTKDYKLSNKEWENMTFVAARPGKFKPMTGEQRAKYSPVYRSARAFYKAHQSLLKEKNIPADWPYSYAKKLKEEIIHLEAAIGKSKSVNRTEKLAKQIREIKDTLEFIKRTKFQYVNIPVEWISPLFEKDPKEAPKIISQFFRERKTLDMEKMAHWLMTKGYIKPEDTDLRKLMASYANKVGLKVAIAEIFNTAEREGIIKDAGDAPDTWQSLPSSMFPTLKGKRVHPVLKDFMEKNFIRMGWQPARLGKILGVTKLLQFYNPVFLPTYDVVQGFWTGAVRSKNTPASIRKAYLSMKNADKDYWDAMYWGAFSTPFTPSHRLFMKQADKIINGSSFLKKTLRAVSIYPWSWDLAWKLDNFVRMITYHHYIAKGFTPREAAQATAKPHGDYAGIPPASKRWMNRLLFTPSFKISMMYAQGGMLKNFAKLMTGQHKKMSKEEIASGKQAVGLAAGIVLRDLIMHALGFETDQYGLRYAKTMKMKNGKKKELVLYMASPDNVFQRIYNRVRPLLPWIKEEHRLQAFMDRGKWELHPLWQLGMEELSNKGIGFEPISNPYDGVEKIVADRVIYAANRILRFTELLPQSKSEKRLAALKAMHNDLGKFGVLLGGFVLPYLRDIKDTRLVNEINRLKRNFAYMKKQDPAKNLAEAEKRQKNFMDELRSLREKLEEWRKKHE